MTRLSNVAVGGKVTASNENSDRAGINKTMQLVTPTSVSTGSIGTYGAVTFSAASSVSLNGCFTSEFDWYEVEIDLTTSAAAGVLFTLRLLGADASTAYDRQQTAAVSATATTSQSLNAAAWLVTGASIAGHTSLTMKLYNPALAVATTGTVFSVTTPNPMTTSAAMFTAGIQHRTATAYDGFTLSVSSGNITGTIRVYGII